MMYSLSVERLSLPRYTSRDVEIHNFRAVVESEGADHEGLKLDTIDGVMMRLIVHAFSH